METRAKDLKDLTMWQLPNSSIKFLDLCDAILAKLRLFRRNLSIAPPQIHGKGFSKFNNKFAMSFLNDQIGQDLSTDVEKSMARHSPFITISFKEMISGFFFGRGAGSFKGILQPMKESNVGVGDLQNSSIMAVFVSIVWFVFKLAGVKTTLSVDNSSQISQTNRIVDFWFVKNAMFMVNVIEFHRSPLITSSLTSVHLKCI